MSITLQTEASAHRNGRCVDCGQFAGQTDMHFHGPKPKFRGRPKAHLYYDGGGMVTRCDDPGQARELLIRQFMRLEMGDREEAEAAFPASAGQVQRGRINVAPDRDEVAWWWMRLAQDAKGPGVTTAVVWAS